MKTDKSIYICAYVAPSYELGELREQVVHRDVKVLFTLD